MKVVLNRGYGAFRLSQLACQNLIKLGWTVETQERVHDNKDSKKDIMKCTKLVNSAGNTTITEYSINFFKHNVNSNDFRTNKEIVITFEKLKNEGLETYMYQSEIEIVDIPDAIDWYIERDNETGGDEVIHEEHRRW